MYLLDFIRDNSNWEELLSNPPYCIKISRDDQFVTFKYNQLASDFNDPIVRECRGLILYEPDMKVVCHPFDKFGNYGESYCPDINWEKASVQEKIDGSLMKVWCYEGTWHISTNGTIDAFKAEIQSPIKYRTYGDLFIAALPVAFDSFTNSLDADFTYMFELVSPYNRVVIPYDNTELYYLGCRNNITQEEVMPENTELAFNSWFKMPRRFQLHSLEDVQNAASELPWDLEGYVVCDDTFQRVKIKSPEYVKAHYARSNNSVSYERLLEVYLAGEEAEFLIYASDYKDEYELVKTNYLNMIKEIKATIEMLNPTSFTSRKKYADVVLKQPGWLQKFLFHFNRVEDDIKDTSISKWIEWMKQIKVLPD